MIQLRFEDQLNDDLLESLVFLSARLERNKNLMLLNENEEISLDGVALERSKALPKPVQITCSTPKSRLLTLICYTVRLVGFVFDNDWFKYHYGIDSYSDIYDFA